MKGMMGFHWRDRCALERIDGAWSMKCRSAQFCCVSTLRSYQASASLPSSFRQNKAINPCVSCITQGRSHAPERHVHRMVICRLGQPKHTVSYDVDCCHELWCVIAACVCARAHRHTCIFACFPKASLARCRWFAIVRHTHAALCIQTQLAPHDLLRALPASHMTVFIQSVMRQICVGKAASKREAQAGRLVYLALFCKLLDIS